MATITDAPRFESLEQMKARHVELLRTTPPGENFETTRARILEFIARATATGVVLDNPADRRIAQGLVDYWKATLYTQRRDGEFVLSAQVPPATVLADFPETDSEMLTARAEAAVTALEPADREVARRILLRLVRLPPAVKEFQPNTVSRDALDDTGNVGQVARVIHALIDAGVVRSSPGAAPGEQSVELAAAHLIRTWPRYVDWLKDRLGLRTAAYLWQQHDRHSSSLVSGPPLAVASTSRDLDSLETEFINTSRAFSERNRRIRLGLGIGLLLAAIAALIVIAVLLDQSRRKSNERAQTEIKARDALLAFEERKRTWDEEKQKLETAQREALHARELLEQRQSIERVFNLNRIIRALSDMVAATGDYERLARWRWDELEKELSHDPYLAGLLKDHRVELDFIMAPNKQADRGPLVLRIARAIRNDSLEKKEKDVIEMMNSIRRGSYQIVKLVIDALDDAAGARKSFTDVRPFYREFLRYYWGALAMVESRPVEQAMIDFKNALVEWETWEKDKKGSWDRIRAGLAKARKNLEEQLEEDLKRDIVPMRDASLPRK